MQRIPNWMLFTGGLVVLLISLMGVFNSEHVSARITYTILIVLSLGTLGYAVWRRKSTVTR